jgi:hypothetical protein
MNIKNVLWKIPALLHGLAGYRNLKKFAGFALAGMTTLRMCSAALNEQREGSIILPLTIKEKG